MELLSHIYRAMEVGLRIGNPGNTLACSSHSIAQWQQREP